MITYGHKLSNIISCRLPTITKKDDIFLKMAILIAKHIACFDFSADSYPGADRTSQPAGGRRSIDNIYIITCMYNHIS